MGNSCTSVFPNTRAWEQQERNKTKKTDEDGKKRGVSMERSKAGTNKRSPDRLSHPNQKTIIISKIWKYFIRNGKSKEIQLTKKQNGLKYSKNYKLSTLPCQQNTTFKLCVRDTD